MSKKKEQLVLDNSNADEGKRGRAKRVIGRKESKAIDICDVMCDETGSITCSVNRIHSAMSTISVPRRIIDKVVGEFFRHGREIVLPDGRPAVFISKLQDKMDSVLLGTIKQPDGGLTSVPRRGLIRSNFDKLRPEIEKEAKVSNA